MGSGAALFTGLTAWCGRPGLGSYLGIVPAFFVTRLALGAFTAPLYPASGRMNANWFPVGKRATVWGLIAAGAGLGGATSPLVFPLTIARYGWRASFWLAAAATGILTFVWLVGIRDRPFEGDKNPGCCLTPAGLTVQNRKTRLRRVLADRNLILLALGYSTVGYFEYIFFFWIYYYFGHVRHMRASQTTIYTTGIFLTWTVMSPLGGLISDSLSRRFGRAAGRRTVAAAGMMAGALCLAAGVNLSNPLAIGMILSLALGLASCSEGPFWASAIDVGGNEVGAACGVLNTGANVGGAIAPLMTPFIAKGVGWSGALYFGSAVAIGGAVIWLFVDPTRRAG
jgi:MFS family permease